MLHSYLHLVFSCLIVVGVSHCFVFHICQFRSVGLFQILFDVVCVILEQSESSLIFDPAPGQVALFLVIELVVGMPLLPQVPQGQEDLLWSDHLVLLVGLVLLLALQFDWNNAGLSGQSGELLGGVHNDFRTNRNADHPSFASCHSGLGKEHHLLEIDGMCHQIIF